jgi:hypothetical protein
MRAAEPSLPQIGHSAAEIGRTAAEFARRSRAPATESAYASDWADFTAWCDSAERLPCRPSRRETSEWNLRRRDTFRRFADTALHAGRPRQDHRRGQSNRTDKSRLLAVLGISEDEYVARFTSPTQTDWVMRCTPRKVLRTAEQEPVVASKAKRAAWAGGALNSSGRFE